MAHHVTAQATSYTHYPKAARQWDLGILEKTFRKDPGPKPQPRADIHSPLWGLQVVVATAISGSYKMPKKYHMQIVGEIQHG